MLSKKMTMTIPASVLICISLSIVYTACVQRETEHTYQQAPVDVGVEADSRCVNWGTGELLKLYGSLHLL